MQQAREKADLLVQAIKYISKFADKIVVVKYGGNAMEDEKLKESVFEDIAMLSRLGLKIVVVHGGGPKIDEETKKNGIDKKIIHGLRVTDGQTLAIIEKVFERINDDCARHLNKHGLSAIDCTQGTLITEITDERLGFVGEIKQVNTQPIIAALNKGKVPVLSSLGADKTGQLTNINADTAASKIAVALQAEKLTVLTNVDSVVDADGRRISHISAHHAEQYIMSGVINSGMIPKVKACIDAAEHGVKKAHLLNGTTPRALLIEIFTDQGIGTELVKS
ncbi:MAG TPA: acetylglutamate kinase [Candidatus Saccharimonadales bacterium]|nr:acetylglutamate kinase [Candidatus Saccharimonadales bacterium]